MPFKSRWSIDVPSCSLPSLIFKSPTAQLSKDPLFIDSDDPDSHYLTLEDYRLLSQRFAAGLRKNGFKPGDRVLLFSGNNIYFPIIFMGTIMAGGIFSGANPTYVARELAYQLQNTEARFLFCASEALGVGLDAASQSNVSKNHIFTFDNSPQPANATEGCRHWSHMLASEAEGKNFEWDPCTKPGENERTITLNYSSGTTGVPKGVMITHKNYVSNVLVQRFMTDLQPSTTSRPGPANLLCFLPMYHAMAQTLFCTTGPLRSSRVYVMPKFDFVKVMDAVEKFRITQLILVPPVVVAMAKHPEVRKWKWDLSSVADITCGAAPLGRPASEEMESLWKGKEQEKTINVRQAWGMTEATCSVTASDPTVFQPTSSVGELSPNWEGRIMSEDGLGEVGPGERGEIWVRGPGVMKGYWRNEKATKGTLTDDGWLMTGDVAYVDEKGNFYIVDRMKELIKVKGNQVAPAELEALLLNHASVTDVAVIGVPLDGDEAPRAYIVRTAGHSTPAEEIAAWLSERVSKTKRLAGGVHFVDVIPKNPSGKILRRQLRDKAAKEEGEKARL